MEKVATIGVDDSRRVHLDPRRQYSMQDRGADQAEPSTCTLANGHDSLHRMPWWAIACCSTRFRQCGTLLPPRRKSGGTNETRIPERDMAGARRDVFRHAGRPERSGVAPARAANAQIEEITWALPGFPNTLLVAHEWNTYNGAIMSLVQEGLLSFDDKLALAPAVAESWQQVDPVTYKYKLRAGVTFQDGSPLTADDVVYTMKWNMNPDFALAALRLLCRREVDRGDRRSRGHGHAREAERAVPVHGRAHGRLHHEEGPAREASRGLRHARRAAGRHRPLQDRRVRARQPRRARGL